VHMKGKDFRIHTWVGIWKLIVEEQAEEMWSGLNSFTAVSVACSREQGTDHSGSVKVVNF
jgi:hypothetical protein